MGTPFYKDYDKLREEAKGTGPSFRLYDQVWEMPPSLPLALMAQAIYVEERRGREAEFGPEEIFEIAHGVFGEDTIRVWMKNGMDLELLMQIVSDIPAMYGMDEDAEGTDLGNPTDPSTGSDQ